jgi:tryptophan synthase alpha chain
MSNRYGTLNDKMIKSERKAFIPFVTIGDPNPELSFKIIEKLIELGADALELGLPFSDPVADGPVIQNANLRALNAKVYTDQAFMIIEKVRKKHPNIPIGLLSYTNLVTGMGKDKFFKELKRIGVDSVLLADMPLEMREWIRPEFTKYDIKQVMIAPPNANEDVLKRVALASEGYIYLLGRNGVTGTEIKTQNDLSTTVAILKKYTELPIYQGFGIASKEDALAAIKNNVDGFIVGSAIVKILEKHAEKPDELLDQLSTLVTSLVNYQD